MQLKGGEVDRAWADVVSSRFEQLKNFTITPLEELKSGPLYVVILQGNEGSFEITASGMQFGHVQRMQTHYQSLSYTTETSINAFSFEGCEYLAVPRSKVNTTKAQLDRQLGMDIGQYCRMRKVPEVVLPWSDEVDEWSVLEGFFSSYLQITSFKGQGSDPLPKSLYLLNRPIDNEKQRQALAMVCSTLITRAVSESPPSWLNSERFAEAATEVAKEGGFKCKALGREQLKELKMGSFLSVAQGTPIDPKLIVMEIEGQDTSKTAVFVGKGLTFDTGGISLKPPVKMSDMKYDLCGGAAVLGTAYYLSQVKPVCNVVCIIGAVENMIGMNATRPGDVVQAMNGKTIEVLNTDAEGRLVLADCLHYGISNYNPDFIVDIATLTGAVLMAFGSMGAAYCSNDEALASRVEKAKAEKGEPLWRLPLWPEMDKEIKSEIADLKNIASPAVKAGTIVAGRFLQEFVGKTPWVHLDVAGTAFDGKMTGYLPGGSNGYGIRLMSQLVLGD